MTTFPPTTVVALVVLRTSWPVDGLAPGEGLPTGVGLVTGVGVGVAVGVAVGVGVGVGEAAPWTVTRIEPLVVPPAGFARVAVMVDVPALMPVTTPVPLTLATEGTAGPIVKDRRRNLAVVTV
jgi:hypothetical protein